MEHRHLLPDEVELLVDGEEGFGIAPLIAHVERCVQCRREFEAQQQVAAELERLPHYTPSPLFAYKVMKNVQVFEPWQVTALDMVRRFVPRSRTGRVLAGVGAGLAGTTMAMFAVWVILRFESAIFVFSLALQRLREIALGVTSSLGSALLGEGAAAAMRSSGALSLTVGASVLLITVVGATLGLRRITDASRRRRS
ncbi:MAG: hypothetical protein MNPFHGCM_00756 [Gemmatimonadaceae bacterium]|nr:hypothetical protein [Gemmatimonadaceae bacterium]